MPLVQHTGTESSRRQMVASRHSVIPAEMQTPCKIHWARWVFYFFSLLVFLLVIFYFPEIRKSFQMLRNVNKAWLGAAVVCQLSSYFFTAMVYRVLLKAAGVVQAPSLVELFRASIILLFFNQTIPSAGVSGNGFFFSYLRKKNIPGPPIISLILTELLTYYVVVLFVTAALLVFALSEKLSGTISGIMAAGLVVYLVFGGAVSWAGEKSSMQFVRTRISRIKWLTRFFQKTTRPFNQNGLQSDGFNVMHFIRRHPAAMVKAFFLQMGLFAADVFTIAALFYGIGMPASLLVISFAVIGSRIITVLPFSPGALILFESSMSFFLVSFGIPLGTAVMITLLFRFLSFWLPIPAGFLLYRQWLRQAKPA